MSEHTPGPWKFGISNFEGFIEKPFDYRGPGFFENPGIYTEDNQEIVGCDEYYIFSNEHDIRLIAAAPDLLAALVGIINDQCFISEFDKQPNIEAARAAIAKATGVKS